MTFCRMPLGTFRKTVSIFAIGSVEALSQFLRKVVVSD